MSPKPRTVDERLALLGDEIMRLRAQNRALSKDVMRLAREDDTAERIRERIFEIQARSPEPPEWVANPRHSTGKRGTPATIWSDWHYGEVVNPVEVGGVNAFNTTIAKQRIKRLVDTTEDICANHMGRANTAYPGIVVCLAGDLMTGDIHQEITESNDRTPQQQINDLTDILAGSLEHLASKFGKVFVPCVVGNHGRDTLKPRTKRRVFTSHEWVIYTNLERHFRKSKNIHFHIPSETDAFFRIYSHRYLLTHGDSLSVKGGDGIIGALGPITRGTFKMANSEKHIGRDFDTLLMGHWHQPLWLPHAIVNGCIKGYDEYARLILRAPYSPPSQQLWFTHPDHGITARWELYLDGVKQAKESEWVSFKDLAA